MADTFGLSPLDPLLKASLGIPYLDYTPAPLQFVDSELLTPKVTVCVGEEAKENPKSVEKTPKDSSVYFANGDSATEPQNSKSLSQTYLCHSEKFCSLYSSNSIWGQMIAIDPTTNMQYMDNEDVLRAERRLVIVTSLVALKGLSDAALGGKKNDEPNFFQNLNFGPNYTPTNPNKIFILSATGKHLLSLYNRHNDIESDTAQLQSLYSINDPDSVADYHYREVYLWGDYSSAVLGATTDALFVARDYQMYQSKVLKDTVTSLDSGKMRAAVWDQSAAHAKNAANLSMAGQVTLIATVVSAFVSSLAKVWEEMNKPREERNDIILTQAVRSMLGCSAALFTSAYRFWVAYSGKNELSREEIFDLIRGRGLSEERGDYKKYRSRGFKAGMAAIAMSIAFAAYQYGPILVKSYQDEKDDVFLYNLLGLTKMVFQGIGSSCFNFNFKGSVSLGSKLYITGALAGLLQVDFRRDGGFDHDSIATQKAVRTSYDLVANINRQRYQMGLLPFNTQKNSVEWYNEWLDPTNYSPKQAEFHAMRRFLIVAGLDHGDHDISVTDKNSFLVLARAGQIYKNYEKAKSTGFNYSDRLRLAYNIILECNFDQ